jgi:hypothetical protein
MLQYHPCCRFHAGSSMASQENTCQLDFILMGLIIFVILGGLLPGAVNPKAASTTILSLV